MYPKYELGPATISIKDNVTGEFLELGNIGSLELEEIKAEHEIYDDNDTVFINPPEAISVKCRLKTISRKRFIKLLMARNIQRNGAQELAKYFFNKRGYYSYIDLMLFDNGVL